MSNDNDAAFVTEFYKNLKILSQDLFKKTATASVSSNVGVSSDLGQSGQRKTLTSVGSFGTMRQLDESTAVGIASKELGTPSKRITPSVASSAAHNPDSADYFSSESLQERMRLYISEAGIPQEYVDRYSSEVKSKKPAADGDRL